MRMRSGSVSPRKQGNTAKPSPRVQADRTISKPGKRSLTCSSGSNCANAAAVRAAVPASATGICIPSQRARRRAGLGEYRQPDLNPTDRSHENAHIKTPLCSH